MDNVLVNFRDGLRTHTEQKYTLGQIGRDAHGDYWSYVQFFETVVAGNVIRDARATDLLSGATGTVTANAAADAQTLADTGEFANDDFVGAIGQTLGDTVANGAGQGFHILEMIDDDTIRVAVHHGDADPREANQGWETALVGSSTTYAIWMPGRVYQGDGITDIVRGVTQMDVTVVAGAEPYGWVKQTGPGWLKLDVSDAAIPVVGEGLVPAAAGLAIGMTAGGTTADEVAAVIARNTLGDIAGTVDALMFVNLQIFNWAKSYRSPDRDHAYNNVTI
jgi:hypothetical protein